MINLSPNNLNSTLLMMNGCVWMSADVSECWCMRVGDMSLYIYHEFLYAIPFS